jgi:hypothetical protein
MISGKSDAASTSPNIFHYLKKDNSMTFTLDANEAAFIVRVLGQLPTESGAYPLHQKLVQQFKEQEVDQEVMQVGGTD